MSACTHCRAELPHQHGGLCRHCYADGQIGYYIPVWLGTPSPAPVEACTVCREREATIIEVTSGAALCQVCWGMGGAGYAVAATPSIPPMPPGAMMIGSVVMTGAIAADLLTHHEGRKVLVALYAQMTPAEIRHLLKLMIAHQQQQMKAMRRVKKKQVVQVLASV